MNEIQQKELKQLLKSKLNLNSNDVFSIKKLNGGAIQENWLICGQKADHTWEIVLRKNAATSVEVSSDREQEYLLLSRLKQQGVQVPQPLYFKPQPNFLGSDFFIMDKINGVTEGFKLVRLSDHTQQKQIVEDIGKQLGHLHLIKKDEVIEKILPKPNQHNYLEQLFNTFIDQLDHLNRFRPILEYAIQWLKNNQSKVDELVLVHGDFRTGNLMIGQDHVSGILDWEFAHWGDRREDIGWFTAKCWRFGKDDQLAGGIGSYKDFMTAYANVTGIFIPEFELKFWHILAHVRWAIIAIQQSDRNLNTEHLSLELALTEFLIPQLEKNILDLLGEQK